MQVAGRPMHGAMQGSSVSPAHTLSCDTDDSPDVIAWTAGRTMNRRHVLVGHALPLTPSQLPLLTRDHDGIPDQHNIETKASLDLRFSLTENQSHVPQCLCRTRQTLRGAARMCCADL